LTTHRTLLNQLSGFVANDIDGVMEGL
jgi:hypothetical protein